MKTTLDSTFSFERLNYSMVWEDNRLLFESLPNKKNLNILSIGSAGDNAFYFLTRPSTQVTVIDLNSAQIHLIKLKIAAFKKLSHKDFLNLFGYFKSHPEKRLTIYKKIESSLEQSTQDYWSHFQEQLSEGLIHQGRLESYFQKFLYSGLKKTFTQQEIDFLLENKDLAKQRLFFRIKGNDLRDLVERFFNRSSFSKEGRSEAHYKYVEDKKKIEFEILSRTLKKLETTVISSNPYLHYIFSGGFTEDLLPDYITEENFHKIRKNLKNLRLINKDVESYLFSETQTNYDFFNLSDIFEYVSKDHYNHTLNLLKKRSHEKARLAYWSLFVPRLPEDEYWFHDQNKSETLSEKDRLWFYENFNLLELK